MSEFLEILTHARRLKASVKELSVAELKDVYEKLGKLVAEREEEANAEAEANAERIAKIAELQKMIESAGLSLDDLGGVSIKVKSTRAARPAKYSIVVEGETVTWTGQGRMPTVFKQQIENGRSIEDFLI
ncbi:H-NS histone family protein [Shewanella sp. SM34]|uniref:H-NS histone family protein n=1 Tax=unclassified Shewanella TaxID=196818 RepID=UPI0021D938F0|nr:MULTISPECIES: H-NS family nucleoid-associated regulatory protein [unclassified Shewanella]MCU8058417.1 H-NS histone family protein [Shewanella sp. SM35]MCU8067369.1 H-NS histone family protein [Shewanella sp. SM34]